MTLEIAVDGGPFGAAAAESIEHLNEHHDDTVMFLIRIMCERADLCAAAIHAVDHDGISVRMVVESGDTIDARVSFAQRAETADDAFNEFMTLLATARARSGESQLTSLEGEFTGGVIPTHITRVVAVAEISARMRQVTVGGGLDRFQSISPDQFVYVLAPPQGSSELTIDERFSWEAYETMPETTRPVGAYYTVRRWDQEARTLDLWVVLHGHGGAGETWGRTAQPGDAVALWGPRQAYERPEATDSVVLFGDETAIPAIAAILEQLPAGDRATVRIVVPDPAAEIELASAAELDLAWVVVDSPPPTR